MEENQSQPASSGEIKTSSNPMGILIIIGVLILIAVGGFMVFSRSSSPSNEKMENTTENTTSTDTMMTDQATDESMMQDGAMEKSFTLTEIAQHSTAEDCWFAVEGRVYDVTQFIASNRHPGGEAILEGCGKDATQLFNTRPMGSGTPHSDNARGNLSNFEIGVLAQ